MKLFYVILLNYSIPKSGDMVTVSPELILTLYKINKTLNGFKPEIEMSLQYVLCNLGQCLNKQPPGGIVCIFCASYKRTIIRELS